MTTRTWTGVALLAGGVLGFLDAAGVIGLDRTLGEWWPLAIIAWAVARTVGERRLESVGLMTGSVGLALLADEQHWISGDAIWPLVVAAFGVALVLADRQRRPVRPAD